MPNQKEADLRQEIVEIGRRVYQHFLVAANDGNISARLDGETVLITPTGVSKGFMSSEDVIKVRLDRSSTALACQKLAADRRLVSEADVLAVPDGGCLVIPQSALVTPLARQIALERHVTLQEAGAPSTSLPRQPSSETPMHLVAYRTRSDVNAVVHTHAPAATAFALTSVRLDEPLMPEVLISVGPVARVPYARSGTQDLPQALIPYLADHNAFLLANHGVVTVGRSLEEAYFQMERLELYARIRLSALKLGPTHTLPADEIAHLTAVWEELRKSP